MIPDLPRRRGTDAINAIAEFGNGTVQEVEAFDPSVYRDVANLLRIELTVDLAFYTGYARA